MFAMCRRFLAAELGATAIEYSLIARWHLARYYRDCVWHRSEAQYDLFLGLDAAELDPVVAQSEQLFSEYRDRARLILVGVITAAICGITIYASFVHLTV